MPFLSQIKEYLNFNRAERNGLIVLFILLLLIILYNILLPYLASKEEYDFTQFEKEVAAFEARQKAINDSLEQNKVFHIPYKKLTPITFDPNKISSDNWLKMGLKENQVSVIENYLQKGGKFTEPDDLAKIYSISENEFLQLKPFIRIEKEYLEPSSVKSVELIPVHFDPNTCSGETFLAIGLSEKLTNTILNYREKGGKFYNKEDFSKIYGLSPEQFDKLEEYIRIDTVPFRHELKKELLVVEINSADTLDLQQLKGIGPSYARRIVKYRDLLGGYHSIEQLLEVYGMDSLRYMGICSNLSVDTTKLNRLNINTAGIKEFIRHPYIEYYLAKSIVTYREESGEFQSLEELKSAKLIYHELYIMLMPYLTVDH